MQPGPHGGSPCAPVVSNPAAVPRQLGRLRILMLETTPMAEYMVTMEEPP